MIVAFRRLNAALTRAKERLNNSNAAGAPGGTGQAFFAARAAIDDMQQSSCAAFGAEITAAQAQGTSALLVQAPFAQLLVNGAKSLELRKQPIPAPLAGKRTPIMQSKSKTKFEAINRAGNTRYTPGRVVGSVIFTGDTVPLLREQTAFNTIHATAACLTEQGLLHAIDSGYRYGWVVKPNSAVPYKAPICSKAAGYKCGAVVTARVNHDLDPARVLRWGHI